MIYTSMYIVNIDAKFNSLCLLNNIYVYLNNIFDYYLISVKFNLY